MSAEDETANESILTESALPWSVPVTMLFQVRSFAFHRNRESAPGTANLEHVFQWWNVSFGKDRNTPLIKQVREAELWRVLKPVRVLVRLSCPVGTETLNEKAGLLQIRSYILPDYSRLSRTPINWEASPVWSVVPVVPSEEPALTDSKESSQLVKMRWSSQYRASETSRCISCAEASIHAWLQALSVNSRYLCKCKRSEFTGVEAGKQHRETRVNLRGCENEVLGCDYTV